MPLLRANRLAPYEQLETFERGNDHLLFDCHAINTTHLGHLIENKLIQASLWQQFVQHNIEMINPSSALTAIEQNLDSITLHYNEQSYTADLVIAADGGQSQLRSKANIGITGWQYQQHCMGVLIKLDAPQQVKTWQQFTPTGPVAFLPMQAPYANLIWYDDANTLKAFKAETRISTSSLLSTCGASIGCFSITRTALPCCANLIAIAAPTMPPPTTITLFLAMFFIILILT